jgi:PEGA domain
MDMRLLLAGCTAALLFVAGGCVERTLSVQSNPPGALVYLNNQEVGRTPVRRDFLWYGDYEVVLRKDGYQTLKTSKAVIAPIYEWVPLDLIAELLPIPFKDRHSVTYNLQPQPQQTNETALLARAQELRTQLQSTKRPATRPTK